MITMEIKDGRIKWLVMEKSTRVLLSVVTV